jgi:predicted ribosome-associated RNA-binding protein Tma20
MTKTNKKKKIITKEIKELEENPVRDYLQKNKSLKLSTKNLSKKLNIKNNKILYFCLNSNLIRKICLGETGSYKHDLNVFCAV